MQVFLTSAYRYKHNPVSYLKSKSIASSSICIDDPGKADVIIFLESHPSSDPYFRRVLHHKLYKKYKRKCVLYHDADLSITPLPTISPSIELWQYNPKHKITGHYIARIHENETINNAVVAYNTNRDYLYSFIGSGTHAVRYEIIRMKHPPNALIKDTTGLSAWELNSNEKVIYEENYCQVMNESFFVLCPRGIGPCTYRLFETMQLGRVPVIISDSWVKIPDIAWDKFSITIKQSMIPQIPEILNERKGEAVEMGENARMCWETCFSPEVSLEQIGNSAMKLINNSYSYIDSIKEHLQFLTHPYHLMNFLRYKKNKLKRRYRLS